MTAPNATVTASADIDGIFKLMRDAFTSSSKVLLELMQNARRAGSPTVEIDYDEAARVMTVTDDGSGIDDFSTLLKLAKSGWDTHTAMIEHAFGAGFWSAVFGCERLHVESKGRGFIADTADILAFRPVEIYACAETRTRVRMIGLHKPMALSGHYGLASAFEQAARGFPLPVFLNGTELARPHALDASFEKSPIGHVRLCGRPHGDVLLYLQGFRVGQIKGRSRHNGQETIVHLDSTQFRARAPDRDCLIDAAEATAAVGAAVKAAWVRHYEELKRRGDDTALLENAQSVIDLGCAHLLNHIPFLPACVIEHVGIDSYTAGDFGRDYYGEVRDMPRAEVEKETLVSAQALASDSDCSSLEVLKYGEHDDALIGEFNRTMYLQLLRAQIINTGMLDRGHWVFRLKNLRTDPLGHPIVTLQDSVPAATITGVCIDHVFVPCAGVTFSGELGEVSGLDAVALLSRGEGRPEIAVGECASATAICKLLASFTDEHDHFISDWLDEDARTLGNELTVARTGDVTVLLHQAIRSLLYASAGDRIDGKRFTVVIDKKAKQQVVVREVRGRAGKATRKRARRKAA